MIISARIVPIGIALVIWSCTVATRAEYDRSSLAVPPLGNIYNDPACEGLNNSHQCARAIEMDRLVESSGIVERVDGPLRFTYRCRLGQPP
jgi:hypothetical protein